MKKMYYLAIMAMLMPFLALAQFTISGKVNNQVNGIALAGASISLNGKLTQTNAGGYFKLSNVPSGSYLLKVRFIGFSTYAKNIEVNADQEINIPLSPSNYVTEDIIVSATRASAESPTTFRNIKKEELEENNLGQDLPYLLNQTPSVVVSSDAGNGIGYTGIRIRGSDPTRVNVTINGIPYTDTESQGTFWVNLPDFASSVDNIQLQRGVGTSTNGAGAFGGSLNIQTTTRNDLPYGEINSSAGSFGTFKNALRAGSGLIKGKFTIDGRLSAISSDGYIDRGNSDLKSFFTSFGYYGKKDLIKANVFGGKEKTYQVWNGVPEAKLKGNNDSLLKHYYNNAGLLYFTSEDSVNLWNSNKRTYSQFRYDDQTDNYQQTHYQLFYTHSFSTAFSLNTGLHYTFGKGYFEEFKNDQSLEEDYGLNSVPYGGSASETTNLVRRRWLENDFYGLTYSLNYSPSSSYSITLGGAYNEYDGDHFGEVLTAELPVSSVNQMYYLGNGFKKDFNTYGRIDFKLGKARVFTDLQYRYIDYAITGTDKVLVQHNKQYNYDFFNPKVGLTYTIDNTSNIYTSYAIANKEPNRDDFLNALPGELPLPERLNNIEAGYRRSGKKYNAGLNLYGMFYKDQLVLTGKINDVGEYIRQNVPYSYRIGIEFDAGLALTKRLNWSANFTLSENKVRNFTQFVDDYDNGGQASKTYGVTDIAFSPALIAASTFSYKLPLGIEAAVLSKYVGKQYLDNTSNNNRSLNSFFVNDLRLQYHTRVGRIKDLGFSVLVNNLFDVRYESNGYTYTYLYGGPVTETFYFPQAGINFLAGINLKF